MKEIGHNNRKRSESITNALKLYMDEIKYAFNNILTSIDTNNTNQFLSESDRN